MYKNGALGLNENNMNKLREQEVNRNDFLETVKESSWHMKSQVDKHSFIIADSVKYSLTFHWVYRNKSVHLVYIILICSGKPTIILELLATSTKKELDEHFERTLKYSQLLKRSHLIIHDIWTYTLHAKMNQINHHWPIKEQRKKG
uniref:Uncharacterized protein n=1 Tax=Rhizophagus irregularis (strain DAOM 181602 / DAOM 197198 / MUCL 43194) TaxID=747089 RepID=U9TBH0_RHIID